MALLLSRGRTHPLGKLQPMPRVRLATATIDALRQEAAAEKIPLAEFVRGVLEARAHGIEHVASMAVARIRRVAGSVVDADHH